MSPGPSSVESPHQVVPFPGQCGPLDKRRCQQRPRRLGWHYKTCPECERRLHSRPNDHATRHARVWRCGCRSHVTTRSQPHASGEAGTGKIRSTAYLASPLLCFFRRDGQGWTLASTRHVTQRRTQWSWPTSWTSCCPSTRTKLEAFVNVTGFSYQPSSFNSREIQRGPGFLA